MTRDERSPISDQGSPAELLRNLSPAAFAALGAEGLAYIKPVDVTANASSRFIWRTVG